MAPGPEAASRPRSEAKDAAARAALVPLREGERPRAVTVAAMVAAALAIGNLTAYALDLGLPTGGPRPPVAVVAVQALVMLVVAVGMWRVRYWAVLGMQVLLGLLIVGFAVLAVTAQNLMGLAVALLVVLLAGTLFWFLVGAMARIQMPARR